ncbi:GTPase Era [Thermodesulfobacteriota bacterium]
MSNRQEDGYLSGFIAITGPPNAGKSTLLNRLLDKKIAIVTPKPQTTRNRIRGVYHGDGFQMVFVDTPGIHKPHSLLHESMVTSAKEVLHEVDIILVIVDMLHHDSPDIPLILRKLKQNKKSSLLLINKTDMGPKELVLPIIDNFRRQYPFEAIIPISALRGEGIERLLGEIKVRLKPGPPFFPENMATDQSETFFIAEVVREKIYLHSRKELPYSSAVTVEKHEEIPEKDLTSISARIHVETESQKAILIGHQGRMIKAIGRSSRLELEKILGSRVYLDLRVRVEKNWSKDTKALRKLGY